MVCEDAVIIGPLLKNHNRKSLVFERNTRQPYNDNLCLFQALDLHLHRKLKEETSKIFNFCLLNCEKRDPSNNQGVHMNNIRKVEQVILPEKRNAWNAMRSRACINTFAANATDNFFQRKCCNRHTEHNERELGLFMEDFRCTEMFFLSSTTYCCYDRKSNM